MTLTDAEYEEERRLRLKMLAADVALKQGLLQYEVWKIAFLAFWTGAAVMVAAFGLVLLFHKFG